MCFDAAGQRIVAVFCAKNLCVRLGVRPSSAERCGLPVVAVDPVGGAGVFVCAVWSLHVTASGVIQLFVVMSDCSLIAD